MTFNLPESVSSERLLIRTAAKCNHRAQFAWKVSPIIYSCNEAIKLIHWLGRTAHTPILSPPSPSSLERRNTVRHFMPQIFASAAEYRHHNRAYHISQQLRTVFRGHHDSRSHHILSRHRKKHRVYTKKYKLLKLRREQEALRRIRKEASDVLEVPMGRRKLLCKYRKSCYDTGIVPDTWDINNILPRFMRSYETQKNFSEESTTEIYAKNESEEKEEVSEGELRFLCRYRKSCYKEVGAEIERGALKVHGLPIFSRSIILPIQKQKSIKEIAKLALEKIEEKERIAALQPIQTKVIIDKTFSEIEEKMKKRLACKYRKSCYDSGIRPEIVPLNNLFQNIYHFLKQQIRQVGMQQTIHKEFKDLSDDEKRVYCKYRKSCYTTGEKPKINYGQIFKYIHIVKKYEEVIPLGIRCKYRKSCYETGILPDLKKKIPKEKQPTPPVQTVTSLYNFKMLCKYRKSCYKRKAQEQQNLNAEIFGAIEELDRDEREQKKEVQNEINTIIEPTTKDPVLKSKKNEESRVSKQERFVEQHVTEKSSNKLVAKKFKISDHKERQKNVAVTTENEKLAYKPKKKKTKEPFEGTKVWSTKKVQKATLPSTAVQQTVIRKEALERVTFKKEQSKFEKVRKNIKNKRIEKGAEDKGTTDVMDVGNKSVLLSASAKTMEVPLIQVNRPQSAFSEEENIPFRTVNIYDENLSSVDIKLLCKYRKSCYKNGILSMIQTTKNIGIKNEQKPLKIRCKYRKSCYETGRLPEVLYENFKITGIIENKEERIPLTLRCKYRKSCYETGKLPEIETSILSFSMIQIENEYEEKEITEKQLSEGQQKLRCKYRKSCYTSGLLPPYLNQTVRLATFIKERYDSPQLKCKYRKSCYENMKLDMQLEKARKKEQRKMQQGIVRPTYRVEKAVKYKEKGQKEEILEEVTEEGSQETRKKKSKELKPAMEEKEYMQIAPRDTQSRQTDTKLRHLNSAQKLKCKYRLTCYDGVPLHQAEENKSEKKSQFNIKDFRRANGAICNVYYISCRKQAGLPILERGPIGPNGRRLCRKKKKEITN
uniref:Uncharacterized protein n=1 Tax=Setaria digitata TaxID=48799 RepID=A0A915PI81_9BILA